MKVLFSTLGIHAGHGGEARYCRSVMDALASEQLPGETARVVTLWDPTGQHRESVEGVNFSGCGSSKVRFATTFLGALMRGAPQTIVLGHVLLAPLAAVARILRPRARVVLLTYGLEIWERPGRVRRLVVRRCVDRVITISAFSAHVVRDSYGLGPERISIVAPAVEAPPPFETKPSLPSLLTVSRLGRHAGEKGIDTLLRSLPAVRRAVPGTALHVIGDGHGRAALQALAVRLGVAPAVHFRGSVSDEELDLAYRAAGVFVLPSTQEGFGIVFLEAWRHALPVVAAEAGAATEVVGGRGVLVPAGDERSLARALIALLDDPERRRSLGLAGRAAIAGRYDAQTFRATLHAALRPSTVHRQPAKAACRAVEGRRL